MEVSTLLDEKGLAYRVSGQDYVIRCLNPSHEDLNPSMRISRTTGEFNCFSCGFGGDIFKYFGILGAKFIDLKVIAVKDKITDILSTKSIALPLDSALYANGAFRGISEKTLQAFGAFISDSLMEGRIIFPIYDFAGRTIGFQGRYMYSDLDPKYKFYPHSIKLPLYPSHVDHIDNSIILVEGILDMINLHDKGLKNAVCTFGTSFGATKKSRTKEKNIEKLLHYRFQGVERIYVMYDGDKSGRVAALNLVDYIGEKFSADTIDLDDGVDPGGFTEIQVKKLKEVLYD